MRIDGNEYALNDHLAFSDDLRTLLVLGFAIVPLSEIVAWVLRERSPPESNRKLVAITFDDGPDFDFYDLPHPRWGVQRSMVNIMRDFRGAPCTGSSTIQATSFVVVSPTARRELDATCMIGRGWWRDNWWLEAIKTGLLTIGNHSWDHNHPTLRRAAQYRSYPAGTFIAINNFEAAEEQIARAADVLRTKAPNPATQLFAYPYGETNEYLIQEYFPVHGPRIGIRAAFTCDPSPVRDTTNVWMLPRYVFSRDWKTPSELTKLLRDA